MAKILDNTSSLQDVLDTINSLGTQTEPNYQSKTVTPTTSVQQVVADSSYDALEKVTVNAIPSNYVNTSDATAVAREICMDKTAYVKGSKVTGTGLIYKTLSATSWYGTYKPTGQLSAGSYIRLLAHNSKYTILEGWANITGASSTQQIRFAGCGNSSNAAGGNSASTVNLIYYNGYFVLWLPSSTVNSIGTIKSIEVELYYRQF